MYASHMQTHHNVLESCCLFMISHLVHGTVSTIQSRANIFSIYIKITLAVLFVCTRKPSPQPLLSIEVCAVKVCSWEGNRATVLASPTSSYSNATSPITYHESFCVVNKEMERAKGERIWRRLCCCDTHAEQYSTRTPITRVHVLQPDSARTASLLVPPFSLCCSLHHVCKSVPIWCQLHFAQTSQIRMWSYSTTEEYSATGCSSPRQWFKIDACLSTNLHVFLLKYKTCLKRT